MARSAAKIDRAPRGGGGTRFRLFPQLAQGYRQPETVEVSSPPGTLAPGPADARMYVANARGKSRPYEPPSSMPPWRGPTFPAAVPDRAGHFDTIPVDSPQFLAAHLFGAARFVLDVWEGYLGREIVWLHAPVLPRLELVPLVAWPNARSGFGALEMGVKPGRGGAGGHLLCLNFDIVAHEVGHALVFAEAGAPTADEEALAVHESLADLVAALSSLHFPSVATRLLAQTGGNLYARNLVSRLGEVSDLDQIRVLDNEARLDDFAGLRRLPSGIWYDPSGLGRAEHEFSAPLSGALWDTLVELFQDGLVARGVVPPDLDARGWTRAEVEAAFERLELASLASRARFGEAFGAALRDARDLLGLALARALERAGADALRFEAVAALVIEALFDAGQGHLREALVENFTLRGIRPRHAWPRGPAAAAWVGAAPAAVPWHALNPLERARRAAAAAASWRCRCRCRRPEALVAAHRLLPHAWRAEAL